MSRHIRGNFLPYLVVALLFVAVAAGLLATIWSLSRSADARLATFNHLKEDLAACDVISLELYGYGGEPDSQEFVDVPFDAVRAHINLGMRSDGVPAKIDVWEPVACNQTIGATFKNGEDVPRRFILFCGNGLLYWSGEEEYFVYLQEPMLEEILLASVGMNRYGKPKP